jgi:hypothetical protein
MAISDARGVVPRAADSEVLRVTWEGVVDVVAQVDPFSAAPYEVSRPKNLLTVPMH